MAEDNEPRIHIHRDNIPTGDNLQVTFKGEQYKGLAILDTKVEIEAGTLCWITWKDKEIFLLELHALINKYAI
jgi:hypothetical protein